MRVKTNVGLAILDRKAELGKGKTRLAKGIGAPNALAAYRHLIQVTASVSKMSGLPSTVFFDPEVGDQEVWPRNDFGYGIQVQSDNLGDRIEAGLEQVLAKAEMMGALIIGTDCPTLTPEILQEAAIALETKDSVLGPTFDGGFYLLGIRSLNPTLFEGIEWSTEHVADQMIDAFKRLGYTCQLTPKLADIDEKEDWDSYQAWRSKHRLSSVVLKDNTLS